MQPTLRAVLVFALGVPFALAPAIIDARLWLGWLLLLGLGLVALVLDALLTLPARRLAVELRPPEVLYIGDPDPLVVAMTASGTPRPVDVELLAELGGVLGPQPALPVRLADAGTRLVEVPLAPTRRGLARVEALWLRWTGPLGLLRRQIRLPMDQDIPVVPNLRAVRSAALRMHSQDLLVGLKAERFVGEGSEFDSLTEYREGLDHRAIDWKASARHRKLLARKFRAERNHQVILALDTGHLMGEPVDGVPKLDTAINASLLLALYSLRAGDRVGLFAFDEQVQCFVEPTGGVQAIHHLQRRLADLAYSRHETNFTLGLTHLASRLRRRSLVVVLTDFVDTVTAELMLENLGRLARRHVVIFVSLRDPEMQRIVGAEPGSLLDIHRAVVAWDLVREREKVVRRLQRKGVFCVDAAPDRVSVGLLNRYLDIKRRELIA